MKSVFIITGLIVLSLIVAVTSILQGPFTDEQVKQTCKDMKKGSLFHQMRCLEEGEDFARFGKNFLKKNPQINAENLEPVILIPGFGGSALEARINKQDSPSWYCFKTYDWFRIWLALSELFVQDCWTDNLEIFYNASNDTYYNHYGVEIRGIDFGGLDGIDYLDYVLGFPLPFTSVYATMIQSLKAAGYEEGFNLRGVPYDFRLPPDDVEEYLYQNIQALVEETFNKTGKKVHIVTHSMGGPLFLYFLNQLSQQWQDTYIASFIPIAGPWAGSPKALRGLISGDNFGIEFLGFSLADKLKFRQVIRTAGGLVFLVPDPLYWPKDQVFVFTEEKNYTASDLAQLFQDVGATSTKDVYEKEWSIIPHLTPPLVPTHCLYGTNHPTEFFYHYATNDFNNDPTLIDSSDLGDGTVPLSSLQECNSWAKENPGVVVQEFDTRDHTSIIEDEDVINYILSVVTGGQK